MKLGMCHLLCAAPHPPTLFKISPKGKMVRQLWQVMIIRHKNIVPTLPRAKLTYSLPKLIFCYLSTLFESIYESAIGPYYFEFIFFY